MSDLVYLREQWQKRAQAAQDCADELGELKTGMRRVLVRNYFGDRCLEGATFFERLSSAFNDAAESIARLAVEAEALSAGALAAMEALDTADRQGEDAVD